MVEKGLKKIPVSSRYKKTSSRFNTTSSSEDKTNTHKRINLSTRRILKITGVIIGLIVFFVGMVHVIQIFKFYNTIRIGAEVDNNNKEKKKEKKEFNFLLMGYGGDGHDGAYLTDTLMIANVNMEKRKVKLVSVPRDIWVRVPTKSGDGFFTKINSVYQMGKYKEQYPDIDLVQSNQSERVGASLLKQVLKNMTGLEIDYFLAIDFAGFVKAIDTLGGVEVDVQRAFDDFLYPVEGMEDSLCGRVPKPTLTQEEIKEREEAYEKMTDEEKTAYNQRPLVELDEDQFQEIATESPNLAYPCRYEHIHFDIGKTRMDGITALKYARSRQALQDGGDFNRAARQQMVIHAVQDKMLRIGFLSKIVPLMDDLDDHIRMDVPFEMMQKFLSEGKNATDYSIETAVISDENHLAVSTSSDGQSILIPKAGRDKWDDVKEYIHNFIHDIRPSPTPDLSKEATSSAGSRVSTTPIPESRD